MSPTAQQQADPTPSQIDQAPTCHDRLLDAAKVVFAREGYKGATTREIAREAQVNEVTLFRLFENKEKLFQHVLQQTAVAQIRELSREPMPRTTLREDLLAFARSYLRFLSDNEALIRTVIGETNRHPEPTFGLVCEAIVPFRNRLVAYLEANRSAGPTAIRNDMNLNAAVDAFTGVLLAGMLRQTSQWPPTDYSPKEHLETVVDLFVRGIQTSPATSEI